MSRTFAAIVATVICILGASRSLIAQANKFSQKTTTTQTAGKKSAQTISQKELEQQEKNRFALSLINSLADEAKNYDDHVVGVRVQAKAADLLWGTDTERARAIFRRAWSLAEDVEAKEQKSVEEKKKKFLSGESQNGFIPLPPNLRGEILQLVGRRDKSFSEELLAKLEKSDTDKEGAEESGKSSSFDPTEPDLAIARRLELALYLLQKGETEKAISIADASLQKATTQGVIFLITLRSKSPTAADARYAKLLANSVVDPTSDATSVSLLSSYVFTPTVIVTITQNGALSRKLNDVPSEQTIPDKLKRDFLRAAAQILLRPLPPAGQDRTSAGKNGMYFTITRLIPLFEQLLPEKVPLLQNQLNLITQNVSDDARSQTDFFSKAGLSSESPDKRQLEDVLQEIDSSQNKNRIDNLYALAARLAAAKNDLRARDYAEKITDADSKEKVLAFVDFTLIDGLIGRKDADKALSLLRKAKLPPLQQIWFMTEIARLFGKKREVDAVPLLEEAATQARKASREETWKANALSAIANTYLIFDKWRSWQLAYEVVEAANAATSFNEDSELSATLQTNGGLSMVKLNAQGLSLTTLFINLAPYNIYQTAGLAGNLKGEYQRAMSLLAVASSQLKGKKGEA